MKFTTNMHKSGAAALSRRWLLACAAGAVFTLTACGGGDDGVDRGPTTLPVAAAKLNGLYWDEGEARLYLTDDASNSLRLWDGKKSFGSFAALPPAPQSGATLGQLTRTADKTFYVTRFGFGTDGTVIAIPKSGSAVNLAGLDPLRRRIGVTTTDDGGLLDGWFVKGATGSVSRLNVSGGTATEQELINGLGKPVGLAVAGDKVYVGDQNSGSILSYSLKQISAQPANLADGKVVATFTTLDGIDLMTAASDGTLFFGGSGGKLFKINPKGETSVLVSGWPKIIGVAFDEKNRRLFAAVGAADSSSDASVRIVPID